MTITVRRLFRRSPLVLAGWVLCGGVLIGCGSAQTSAEADLSANERDVEIVHESCDSDSSSARRVDVNGDGKPDIINVIEGGREVCRVVDLNLDGAVDAFIYYDVTGNERRRESDFDRDGRADEIATLEGGVVVAKQRETNFDGKLDTWDTYAGGRLTKRERDSDGDKIVDQWWDFNSDDPKCAIVASDKNADGKPDRESMVDLCADPNAPFVPVMSSATPPPPPAPPPSGAPLGVVPPIGGPPGGPPGRGVDPPPGIPGNPSPSGSAPPPASAPPAGSAPTPPKN